MCLYLNECILCTTVRCKCVNEQMQLSPVKRKSENVFAFLILRATTATTAFALNSLRCHNRLPRLRLWTTSRGHMLRYHVTSVISAGTWKKKHRYAPRSCLVSLQDDHEKWKRRSLNVNIRDYVNIVNITYDITWDCVLVYFSFRF